MEPAELAEGVLARDRSAVAAALNIIEDQRPEPRAQAAALLDLIEGRGEAALRVGITGAPGAGKSSLIDALVRSFRERDQSVGIIAVDPSSQRSGGAILGDRVRLRTNASDSQVFVRSMAARSHLGGLAEPTRAGVIVLAAAFDVVFVETVGVGQSEAEIVNVVDTLVFVAQPGAGDTIQFIKAGILEIPDIFAVNKADLGPLAERTRHELFASLGLAEPGDDGWKKPVILTAARDGRGVPEVAAAITEHRRHLESKDLLRERRRRGREANVVAALSERYGSFGIERLGGEEALRRRIAEGPDVRTFGDLINRLAQEIEAALMGSS